MGRPLLDMRGKRFGRLVVVKYSGDSRWECLCDCGETANVLGGNLRKGDVNSCGCYRREATGNMSRKHGRGGTRLYMIWKGMKSRCYARSNKCYEHYGGRGVSLCDSWEKDFPAFEKWALSNGYEDSLSIDRINPNLGYSPENCRWATVMEQARNKRDTIFFELNGEIKPLVEWCEMRGVNYDTARNRIGKQNLRGEDVFGPPRHNGGRPPKKRCG